MKSKNIYGYFKEVLGVPPKGDSSLKELPIDSPCGRSCKKCIDAAMRFYNACDPYPDTLDAITKIAFDNVEVFWRG